MPAAAAKPAGATIAPPGGVPERPKGAGCKPVGSAYGGSNPPAPTSRPRPAATCRPAEPDLRAPPHAGTTRTLRPGRRRPPEPGSSHERPSCSRAASWAALGQSPAPPKWLRRAFLHPQTEIRRSSWAECASGVVADVVGVAARGLRPRLVGVWKLLASLRRPAGHLVAAIKKPTQRRQRVVRPLRPAGVEAIRAQLLKSDRIGDATLVFVLAYAGLCSSPSGGACSTSRSRLAILPHWRLPCTGISSKWPRTRCRPTAAIRQARAKLVRTTFARQNEKGTTRHRKSLEIRESPVTDSNRRPPPYHGTTAGNWSQPMARILARFGGF